MGKQKKPQGFATFTPEKQREVSSMGGKAAHAKGVAHKFTPEEARQAGLKGGRPKKNINPPWHVYESNEPWDGKE